MNPQRGDEHGRREEHGQQSHHDMRAVAVDQQPGGRHQPGREQEGEERVGTRRQHRGPAQHHAADDEDQQHLVHHRRIRIEQDAGRAPAQRGQRRAEHEPRAPRAGLGGFGAARS